MRLSGNVLNEVYEAAIRLGNYGKITISFSGGVVDIISEDRKRVENGGDPGEPGKSQLDKKFKAH